MLHHRMTASEGIHQVHNWEVADATALAALTLISTDVGKTAFQLDTKKFYILENSVGPVWRKVGFTDTASVPEGTSLYFTTARVLATALTGLSTAAGTVVTAAHTILQAIGFLQKQVSDNTAAIALLGTPGVVETSGTFTPTIAGATTAGAHTYSVQAGFWYKHGKLLHVQGHVRMTAKDAAMAGAAVYIAGLPTASLATANSYDAVSLGYWEGIVIPAGKVAGLVGLILTNDTKIQLYWPTTSAAATSMLPADITAGSTIIFSATYIVP